MTALLVVETLLLVSFWATCGAILWELRRARLEAHDRGERLLDEAREQLAIDLVLEAEARRTRQAVEGRA